MNKMKHVLEQFCGLGKSAWWGNGRTNFYIQLLNKTSFNADWTEMKVKKQIHLNEGNIQLSDYANSKWKNIDV